MKPIAGEGKNNKNLPNNHRSNSRQRVADVLALLEVSKATRAVMQTDFTFSMLFCDLTSQFYRLAAVAIAVDYAFAELFSLGANFE